MAFRRFTDRDGVTWEIRDRLASEWEFTPVEGPGPSLRVRPPRADQDPFDLSNEALQQLLDAERPGPGGSRKSPFRD